MRKTDFPPLNAASLPAHKVCRAKSVAYPLLIENKEQSADGILVYNLQSKDIERLDYYEAVFLSIQGSLLMSILVVTLYRLGPIFQICKTANMTVTGI
ncbi:gamma-glutamylcyclotransferase [Parasulfitobacter algicola]|uniref:Gamma-glutamylcyclotransferase n=1 Tax=Parasulfitobacter algicola TaxID=2614809 RepID=A0ABX2ISW2_9RHOB|nr:gamma-glutamylcyclotransferase [Sulfitobacter algicola]